VSESWKTGFLSFKFGITSINHDKSKDFKKQHVNKEQCQVLLPSLWTFYFIKTLSKKLHFWG